MYPVGGSGLHRSGLALASALAQCSFNCKEESDSCALCLQFLWQSQRSEKAIEELWLCTFRLPLPVAGPWLGDRVKGGSEFGLGEPLVSMNLCAVLLTSVVISQKSSQGIEVMAIKLCHS